MQADSHPALLYEALLPFLSKEDANSVEPVIPSLGGQKTVQAFFQGSTKKTFPETNGKDFMLHSFKGIVLTLSCFK